ncbi:MAG: gliding motility-associated C-terminal domain-containing protein, partial [Flavobacteriales bacterium]
GKEVPKGTYYYILQTQKGQNTYNGWIQVVK